MRAKWLKNRWLKTIPLLLLPLILYTLISKKAAQRPHMVQWNPRGASYPVVNSLTFLSNGIFATATDEAKVRLWDTSSAMVQETIEIPGMPRCGSFANRFIFSPDGKLIANAECDEHTVRLWEMRSGRFLRSFSGQSIINAAALSEGNLIVISPDSKTIAIAGAKEEGKKVSGIVDLWDIATGRRLQTLLLKMPPVSVAFSANGRQLLSAGGNAAQWFYYRGIGKGGEVKIWDARTGTLIRTLSKQLSPPASATFSPDGKTLAIAANDGAPTLWNAQTGQPLPPLKLAAARPNQGDVNPMMVRALLYSPDGTLLAGVDQREVHLWDVASGNYLRSCQLLNTPETIGPLDVEVIAFSPDSSTLAIAAKRNRTVTWMRVK